MSSWLVSVTESMPRGYLGAVGSRCDDSAPVVALSLALVVLRADRLGAVLVSKQQDPAEKLAEATAEAREVLREVRGALRDLAAARKDADRLVASLGHEMVQAAMEKDLKPRFDQVMAEITDLALRLGREVQDKHTRMAGQIAKETIQAVNAALREVQSDPVRYLVNPAPVRVVLSWREDSDDVPELAAGTAGYQTLVDGKTTTELVAESEAVDPLRIQR